MQRFSPHATRLSIATRTGSWRCRAPWLGGTAAVLLSALLAVPAQAQAQLSLGVALPGLSIGINVPDYPRLQRVPGYPVYYDPQGSSNYFFYDGLYWVYRDDTWYESSWYNGPWQSMDRNDVPLFLLRVPVRYYRQPPSYFRGWGPDSAPRWGQHWGGEWQRQHADWDLWDRRHVPDAAPLPSYQRRFAAGQYPSTRERQAELRGEQYRYQPHEAVTLQRWQQPQGQPNGGPQERGSVGLPEHTQARPEPLRQPPQAQPEHRGEAPRRADERRGEDRKEEGPQRGPR